VSSYLIEAEETKPSDEDPPVAVPRPPRPEHRRVYTSLILTTAILVGTVVAVYMLFPARHHVLATSATTHHRTPTTSWELPAPTAAELRAWSIGVLRGEAPLPAAPAIGAQTIEYHSRNAALVRLHAGADEITYVIARAAGVSPASSRVDGELRVVEWRRGPWAMVAIGPDATSASWKPIVNAP
jgi:hypothetical protein